MEMVVIRAITIAVLRTSRIQRGGGGMRLYSRAPFSHECFEACAEPWQLILGTDATDGLNRPGHSVVVLFDRHRNRQ